MEDQDCNTAIVRSPMSRQPGYLTMPQRKNEVINIVLYWWAALTNEL